MEYPAGHDVPARFAVALEKAIQEHDGDLPPDSDALREFAQTFTLGFNAGVTALAESQRRYIQEMDPDHDYSHS
jgi:hypothetical protein